VKSKARSIDSMWRFINSIALPRVIGAKRVGDIVVFVNQKYLRRPVGMSVAAPALWRPVASLRKRTSEENR
jgi:hypothetical protein